MGTQEKLKKINFAYLLLNIFGPLMLIGVGIAMIPVLPYSAAYIVFLVSVVFAILWWAVLSNKTYQKKKEKKLAELDAQGFFRNQTFDADGCTVAIDLNQGMVAVLFRWNPSKLYVVPASRITKVWADDGRGGAGFLEGTSRVSFLFVVDGITVRVNTFISNRRWRMDDKRVLTGISKADMMVEKMKAAGACGV